MSTDPGTNKVILLAVGGILLAIAALIFAGWQLFGDSTNQSDSVLEQPTYFPSSEMINNVSPINDTNGSPSSPDELPVVSTPTESESPSEPLGGKTNSDWQDEIIEISTKSSPSNQPTYVPTYEPTYTPEPTPNYDLPSYTYVPYISAAPPSYSPSVNYYLPSVQYEELDNKRFSSCGSLSVPTTESESEIDNYISKLGKKSAIICLGKAIVNDCKGSKVKLSGGVSGYIYVGERNDGVCSIGTSEEDDTVSFCSVESLMNSSVYFDMTFSEWQEVFKDEPGQTFVDAYQDSVYLDPSDSVSASDCIDYEL